MASPNSSPLLYTSCRSKTHDFISSSNIIWTATRHLGHLPSLMAVNRSRRGRFKIGLWIQRSALRDPKKNRHLMLRPMELGSWDPENFVVVLPYS